MTPDTVRPQPFAELGLTAAEYEKILDTLGRRPTDAELALYSVMWSEHCSYKSSKVYLRQLAPAPPASAALLAGIGHNAGVVDIGQGYAVTFKIESHNHPSYVEPHQGAATGVGGIVRDILAMGARPVAVMDALRFGPAAAPDTGRVLPGVVSGISFYGNCLGLPNIGGELDFDACYAGNPLVNALCVGVMRHGDLQVAAARGPGNQVILFGSTTGPDGVGGASVLASAAFGGSAALGEAAAKRPSVQVGDPFLEKLLVECCLELFAGGLVVGIQDLGAAGVACATTELAAAGTGGMRVRLDAVPLRDPSLGPPEILMSESQERMMAVVEPDRVEEFLAVCAKWDVRAAVIGEVTGTGRLVMTWHGEVVVDIPPGSAADGPVYHRPVSRPAAQDALVASSASGLPRSLDGASLRADLLALIGSPGLADKSWVTDQYDRYVRGDTVLAMPEDGGLVRVDKATGLGIALATDGNGRYCRLDPYLGTQLVLSEAYRNVAVTGARPLAVTNCLNFGSPEDPAVMWQFAEAVRGLADGCAALGVPVTGGNVSFYNQTGTVAVHPTPVIGVLGVHDDVRRRLSIAFGAAGASGASGAFAASGAAGAELVLLGRTGAEFGGSAWAHVRHGHLGGRPPVPDLAAERRLAGLLAAAASAGLLAAAHDLSDGGLAVALAESCLRGGSGCRVRLPGDPFTALFSESAARAVVAVRPGVLDDFAALREAHGVPGESIGRVGGEDLVVEDCFAIPLAELAAAHGGALPALFG
ncbi:MAG TPA: phosphoribosylformylglycinamidine synthase subunit PurL [Streptosporangiaceae bacterium]|nr:phosphoribosylformylglycinamidine synthase subunit PurL [Streptosporangiaceae bacterium]